MKDSLKMCPLYLLTRISPLPLDASQEIKNNIKKKGYKEVKNDFTWYFLFGR